MKNKNNYFATSFLTALLFGSSFTQAQTLTWDVTGGGDWDDLTANWAGAATTFTSDGTQDIVFDKADGGFISVFADMNPKSTTVSATAGTYTFSGGPITGTGTLTKSGAGTLVLSSVNTFTGATTVNEGTLRVNANNFGGTSGYTVNSPGIIRLAGATGTALLGSVGLPISGDGKVEIPMGGNGSTGLNFDMSGFTGNAEVSGGRLPLNPFFSPGFVGPANGRFTLLPSTTLYLGWQGTAFTTKVVLTSNIDNGENLGVLRADTAMLNGTVDLEANSTIGSAGGTFTLNSVISDGAGTFGFTKVAAGTVLLNGVNTYEGPTIVNGGTLQAPLNTAFGSSSSFTVASNAILLLSSTNGNGYKWPIAASTLSGAGTVRMTLSNQFNTGLNFNMGAFTGVVEVSNGQLGFHPWDSPNLLNISVPHSELKVMSSYTWAGRAQRPTRR